MPSHPEYVPLILVCFLDPLCGLRLYPALTSLFAAILSFPETEQGKVGRL
jgi:hypothetical protein